MFNITVAAYEDSFYVLKGVIFAGDPFFIAPPTFAGDP